MSEKTRVIQSTGDYPKWQAQYWDAGMALWFDIGDARTAKADAEKREAEYLSNDTPEVSESSSHEDGDGCAVYSRGYDVETDMGSRAVEDLNVGDIWRDEGSGDDAGTWWRVDDVAVLGDDVHVDFSAATD